MGNKSLIRFPQTEDFEGNPPAHGFPVADSDSRVEVAENPKPRGGETDIGSCGGKENGFCSFLEKPSRNLPTRSYIDWLYVVDLNMDTLSVAIPRHWGRLFCLKSIPRSLFDP